MICGLADMPLPITVISAMGCGWRFPRQVPWLKPPLIMVPSLLKSPVLVADDFNIDVFWFVLERFAWMNLAPESAKPTRVLTLISGSSLG